MGTRQAEFLAHGNVPLAVLTGIGVYDEQKAAEVREIINASGVMVPVKVKPGWYF